MIVPKAPIGELPIVADVDIVIIGATAAAVSTALSAHRHDASVYVISSRPYFGEDICAAYRFWPKSAQGNALSHAIFLEETAPPPTPLHVKLTLEQQLIMAGIPFLFNCFPAGLLRDDEGTAQGVAIANRTGLQAIRARMVVDATLDAMVLKQAGHQELHCLKGSQQISYVTLCEGDGTDAQGINDIEHLPGYQCEEYQLSARRYQVDVDFGDGGPKALADAYSALVDQCWVYQEYRHQMRVLPTLMQTEVEPTLDELIIEPGLIAITEAIQLKQGAEFCFCNPITAMRIAEAISSQLVDKLPAKSNAGLRVTCAESQKVDCGELRTLHAALRPEAQFNSTATLDTSSLPSLGTFDVVVAGGGTGGAPAAISAARAGARTLVVELTSGLGGVGTMGQIANYWCGNRVGFTAEIDQGVRQLEHKDYFKENSGSWSVSAKQAWYHQTGRKEGCSYWFNTLCAGVLVKDNRVSGLLVAGPYGYGVVKTRSIVDSTGCSDIPAAAGAPTMVIGKDHIAVQGTGLAGIKPGRDYHNSDHSFSDDTDIVDSTAFLASSKLKFKGDFDCGELVDSRERRQIIGDYSITPVDILFNRRFPDTVCVATSNFDSHGFTVDPVFMLVPPNKKDALWADIPLRCLLPKGLDGVLVTGLGLSAHRDALPVIRMQADVQNQGYAAGYIAALSADSGKAIREMDIREIQGHLVSIGGLPERVMRDEDSFPVSDEAMEGAVENGWDSLPGVALMLHESQRSRPLVRQAYSLIQGAHSRQSIRYAQILALLGDPIGSAEIQEEITCRAWDEGWRFRGMHQFGMSLSEVDTLLICLGTIGDSAAWRCILEKINTLPKEAEFSHFRAICMCCEALYEHSPNDSIAPAIANLINRPGYLGNAQLNMHKAQADLTDDINENEVRDRALREIHLARALYRCGDYDNLGQKVLEEYCGDIRGHFARHARSILAQQLVAKEELQEI
ncbi:FAD-dependent oxidoreductase [Rubellicoccus peritrichatus]|uniref:FAD-dependent oxidoreductase n=1 Tax=Rubellicoccus peritrichatus TaxID=3080537 RepID=A0AAQ3L8W4_9BACT|nr:FAD-dependent oxidoreductase [Puniceicoccus sp. CR14]WOO40089.1 FAD-dependent oxidoreductase [Puniceicoccus sp. CR14]